MAVRLETNPAGTEVTEVVVSHEGHEERYRGDIVVVSCGAANSAKLLLASANDAHPHGLANGSDLVGRNYMFHDSQAVLALSRDPNPTKFQKTLAINDFYFRGPDFDYPMGGIQMIGKSQPDHYRGEKPLETKFAPHWTLKDVADHAVDFWLATEDLPSLDNRVTLDGDGNIRLSYTNTNPTAAKRLYHQLRSMLGVMRMHEEHLAYRWAYMKNDIPVAGVAHQSGTCRFGNDPANSVLDTNCRAHEVDNLYVVDTSFFPSIGAVNPALTAMANAIRVGDHLLQRMGVPVQAAATARMTTGRGVLSRVGSVLADSTMTTNQVLLGVGLILVLAVGSQVLANQLRIPALIIMLPAGFAAGALTTTSIRRGCWVRRSSPWCRWPWQ